MEGNQAHIAATCLPRKGKASHSCEGSEQTWQQTGAASATWDVTEEQLPPRGPCRHTWLLSSGFHPGSSPAKDAAIWQQDPLWEERGGRSFPDPREQRHRGEAGSIPNPDSWNHPKASRYYQHTTQESQPAPPPLPSTSAEGGIQNQRRSFSICLLVSHYGQVDMLLHSASS